jgi:hypothetical protein
MAVKATSEIATNAERARNIVKGPTSKTLTIHVVVGQSEMGESPDRQR